MCIKGQAGTGKSVVVDAIQKTMTSLGENVAIICSSGLSCEVYRHAKAKTVHSFYGLNTAELPYDKLVLRSLAKSNVVAAVKSATVVIWDEVSMSSQRMLEIVNCIQHLVWKTNKPFGGIQFILVGDFWQLSPIASVIDYGNFAFTSEIFKIAFPHCFKLSKMIHKHPYGGP